MRYLTIMAITVFTLLVTATLVNAVIDPYGLYGWIERPWLNARKPTSYNHRVAAKTARAERVDWDVLAIGNSRIDVGFDPQSQAWSGAIEGVFNAGIPGAGTRANLALLERLLTIRPARLIVVAVDYLDFDVFDPAPARTVVDPSGWTLMSETLLSTRALADSLATIMSQNRPETPTMTARGFNPPYDYRAIVRLEGHGALRAQKLPNTKGILERIAAADREADTGPTAIHPSHGAWRDLEALASRAQTQGMELVLITHPYHLDVLRLIEAHGQWPRFEAWKRQLSAVATIAPGTRLIDFSLIDERTTECFPSVGDRDAELAWYWEPSHYKAALGDLMIARITAKLSESSSAIGVPLIDIDIEQHFQTQRRKLDDAVWVICDSSRLVRSG